MFSYFVNTERVTSHGPEPEPEPRTGTETGTETGAKASYLKKSRRWRDQESSSGQRYIGGVTGK